MAAVNGNEHQITIYTNHRCPYAHRAHIVLKELGLKYEEVFIDLDTPREPWYLEINPRGLVPSIKFDGEILTESAIVAQFLVDVYPSHLLPATGSVEAGLKRARINFFVDTWNTKANSYWYQVARKSGEEREQLVKDFVAVVKKEIEPLLKDANPFFGGSEKITLAEAIVAPFILRIFTFAEHGILPESLLSGLNDLSNFSKWAAEVIKQESVLYIWDAEAQVATAKKRFAKLQAESK
ncbi:thioredoxin-like protein [Lentithecium fluviatile CBS 122367]|uniref:Thioredoxin-like protein n=1 Tax=Lentithecium fluviatile CBS 122367 TaxID=1168545 RepID=A0A6G1JJ10_9PLEO|nr:thioredoxin-like protein [Lentithecium fluviatile CBS 122367]